MAQMTSAVIHYIEWGGLAALSGRMLTFLANPQQWDAVPGKEAGRFLGSSLEVTTQETTPETTRSRVVALLSAHPSLTRQQPRLTALGFVVRSKRGW